VTTLTLANPQATHTSGVALAELLEPNDVVLLTGDLGAGKTTFAKGIAEGLEVAGTVTSPTFNILLAYPGRLTLNHFDLYRLERPADLDDIDYWGVLGSGGVSVVEWGDKFTEALPDDYLLLSFELDDGIQRRVRVDWAGIRGESLAARWVEAIARRSDVRIEEGS